MKLKKLVSALEHFEKSHATWEGSWKVKTDEDGEFVFLVWEMDEAKWDSLAESNEFYGDEPWRVWGGDVIMHGLEALVDSGIETLLVCGEAVVQQWVKWPLEEEKSATEQYRIQDKENVNMNGNVTLFSVYEYREALSGYLYVGRYPARGYNATDEKCVSAYLSAGHDSDEI